MATETFELRYTKSRQNLFHVPAEQWKKWGAQGRQVFNEVYSSMWNNRGRFTHPKSEVIPLTHWKTLCWNAAWCAADAVSR